MQTGRPAQKKQLSRKGKKAWRKNIDLDALEQLREDQREAEIVLGSAPLFEIDTKADENELTNAMKQEKKLKSHEILYKRSAIPGLDAAHKKKEMPKKKAKLLVRKARGEDAKVTIEQDGLNRSGAFDLWDAPSEPLKKVRAGEAPQAPVQNAPHVELPEEGKSYNPSQTAWKSLIEKEHARLEAIEADKEKIAAEHSRIQALIQQQEDESSESEESSDEEIPAFDGKLSVNNAAENKKKTKQQRNKAKRHADQMRLHQRLRELKKQAAELESIKAEDLELLNAPPTESRPKKYRGLRSKHAIMENPLEVKLSDEIEGSLRRLIPEGNVAKDRFRSLQRRGIIESRIPVRTKRRYPKIIKEKWTYKDFNKSRPHGGA